MNAFITFRIVLRLRAGRVTTSRSPVKRKRQNWQTTWKKARPQHLFESLCIDHLATPRGQQKAITRAFDDDVEFQERMAEHIRYMVETIAHHQVDIDSEV